MFPRALALSLVSTVAYADEVIEVEGRLPKQQEITRDELDASPQVYADDIVRTLPSAGTFRRSSSAIADPTSQGLNLRGVGPSGVSRALVLRDGVPVNDPFGGWMYWRAISPLAIDRVEVAPSGASALFGNYALGGAIDVVSRKIVGRAFDAVIAGGSLGTARSAIRATERFGTIGVALDAEALRTRGYAPIAEAQRGAVDSEANSSHASASVRVERAGDDDLVHVTARGFRESLFAGTQFTTADVKSAAFGVGYRTQHARWALRVEAFGGVQQFTQDRARVAAGRASAELSAHQVTTSNDQGALATVATKLGDHALSIGADARRVSGVSVDEMNDLRAGGSQVLGGVFTRDVVWLGSRVEVDGAVRVDAWDRDVQLDPRLGIAVHVSEHLALRAAGYRAFRAPTLNELYRPFQVGTIVTAANSELRAETLWGAEAGPQLTLPKITVRATAFYNRLSDPVANVTIGEGMRQRQNLGAARIAGLELDAAWKPSEEWSIGVAHTFVDSEVISAPAAPMLVGKRLPQDPRLRTTATITYDDPRYATVTAQARHLGRMFEDDRNELPIGAVILVDARVARAISAGISAFAAVQNLFDRRYLVGRAGIDTEGAPRTVEVGLTYRY